MAKFVINKVQSKIESICFFPLCILEKQRKKNQTNCIFSVHFSFFFGLIGMFFFIYFLLMLFFSLNC